MTYRGKEGTLGFVGLFSEGFRLLGFSEQLGVLNRYHSLTRKTIQEFQFGFDEFFPFACAPHRHDTF